MLVSLFGIGTLAQSNSIIAAANSFGIPITISVIVLGIAVIAITIGGINRISKVSEKIVPIMTFAYIGAAIWVLIMKMNLIPGAFYMILKGAFVPEAILGAGAGATIMTAVHLGISRGIFSHESGLGSAAVASATAKTDSCVKQGLISMIGAFLTVVVCTVTGLVIIVTSTDTSIFTAARTLEGSELTAYSFGIGIGMLELGKCIVNLGIIFFAFTTIIGWNYYGEKFAQYLMGNKMVIPFKILFVFLVILGPFLKIDMTFIIADIVIGLMAIPNIIGIIGLRKEIIEETNKFFRRTMG
jgi:AGCS family alanine or glycine:cation symporter